MPVMTMKNISLTLLFAAVLLIPANALANSVDDFQIPTTTNTDNKLEPDWQDTPNPMAQNIETNETQLARAHSDLTQIMMDQNQSLLLDYTGPDIPFTMVYIDDDTLVVGLDPVMAYPELQIEPELIQHILGISIPVEIQYVTFEAQSHSSEDRTKSWQDRYANSCQPVKPGYQKVCEVYKSTMQRLHIPIPEDASTPTPVVTAPTVPTVTNPCDENKRSTACYYYGLYQDRCTDGKTYKRCSTYSTLLKNFGYPVPSTTTQAIPKPVVLPSYELQNIETELTNNAITVSWDKPTDYNVRYYKIYVSENGGYASYKTRVGATDTSYTVSDVKEG